MASSPTGKAAIDEIKQNITAGGEHLTIHAPVAICPLAALGHSIWALMAMTQTRLTDDMNAVIGHKHEFCFETYVILENGIEKNGFHRAGQEGRYFRGAPRRNIPVEA